ncbi:MAG: hypothetical protein Kow0080_07940 [Candidatus Promineifilaceae bacterium]
MEHETIATTFPELWQPESKKPPLETAVILCAFIISASIFALAVTQAALVPFQQYRAVPLSAVEIVSVTGTAVPSGEVDSLVVTLGIENGRVSFASPSVIQNIAILIDEKGQQPQPVTWQIYWHDNDGDNLLEPGELAGITLPKLQQQLTTPITPASHAAIIIKSIDGEEIVIPLHLPDHLPLFFKLK